MATLAEIDAEIARRQSPQQGVSLAAIDAELAKRQAAPQTQPVTPTADPSTGGLTEGLMQSEFGKPGGEEALGTIASGILAEPIAGLAGLVSAPFVGMKGAEENINSVREALTFQPRSEKGQENLEAIGGALAPVGEAVETAEKFTGDIGFEATGSPAVGAIGSTLPTAALEAIGLGFVRKGAKAAQTAQKAADSTRAAREAKQAAEINRVKESLDIRTAEAVEAAKPKQGPSAEFTIKGQEAPEVQDYQQILDNLKNQKAKKAAIDAMPDAEIMKAAEDLGVDLNPDHYSNNRVFRELTQRLKDRPGSKLGAVEERAIQTLGQRADELISDLGGQRDKSLLDANLKNDLNGTISDLEIQSDAAYKIVDTSIPKTVIVKPLASRAYIQSVMKDLGGETNQLAAAESKLMQIMDKNPTYAALDRLRKDVGNGFRKKAGPFKDDDMGTLKQVYRVLSEDQQGVSDIFGVGADYAAARRLVASRKQIEDQAIKLFGRETGGSIIPKLTQAGTALTKGDTSKFSALMSSIPANRRAEAAATMLNDIFTSGARTSGALGQGFVKAFEGLNRNAGAKNILFNELPEIARSRFDKIGKVSAGLFRAKSLENTSKTAGSLIAAMDDGGMFSKVYDVGRKAVVAEGVSTAVGLPGAGTAGVIGTVLAKGRTPASMAADSFITSNKFKQAIQTAAKENNPKRADAILKSSPEFKKWKSFLSKEDAKQLGVVGFISYITDQNEDQQ